MTKQFSQHTEETLIGLLINQPHIANDVNGLLTEEHFHIAEHRAIYSSIVKANINNNQVDTTIINEYLKEYKIHKEDNWLIKLADLSLSGGIQSMTDDYIKVLTEFKKKRDIEVEIEKVKKIIAEGDEGTTIDSEKLSQDLIERITEINEEAMMTEAINVGDAAAELMSLIFKNKGALTGIGTGYETLDKLTGGFQNGEFNVIAARPGIGKSAVMLNWATKFAKQDIPTAIFSFEMPYKEIAARALAIETKINTQDLKNYDIAKPSVKEIQAHIKSMKDTALYIEDDSSMTLDKIVWKVNKLVKTKGIKVIFVDYIGLVKVKGLKANEVRHTLSEVTRTLKQLAMKHNIVVFGLSQLNRNVESRENKRPLMSDLRESGSVEQDANKIIMLYNDWIYEDNAEKKHASIQPMEWNLVKNRDGATGVVYVEYNKNISSFIETKEPIVEIKDNGKSKLKMWMSEERYDVQVEGKVITTMGRGTVMTYEVRGDFGKTFPAITFKNYKGKKIEVNKYYLFDGNVKYNDFIDKYEFVISESKEIEETKEEE